MAALFAIAKSVIVKHNIKISAAAIIVAAHR